MSLCSSCRTPVADKARFCGSCGAAVSDSDASTVIGTTPARTPARPGAAAARPAGTILAGRYRVVRLLGRGGMGEVVLADDLTLDQPVALKFLPQAAADDPAALTRLRNEVRVARQVSHPNVCRIFDIGEADGASFLTMEYVDGEDLASLLRRIGRLPADKAHEIAQQLCAGLGAAHDAGILHRDLKPANVMIDGRGRVRITDFGLAEFEARIDRSEIAGTPAYMAPELLKGGEPSVRSDLYALGLVIYEMVTGRPAFKAVSLADRVQLTPDSSPPSPTSVVKDVDQAVERVIDRCLDPDPAKRPASASAVARALPGGNPLAAALAAGETPSPEMVAAAGGVGALRPLTAWSLGIAIVLLTGLVGMFSDAVSLPVLVKLDQSPVLLREQARAALRRFGHVEPARDDYAGYDLDYETFRNPDFVRDLADWSKAFNESRATMTYWYRESPAVIVPVGSSGFPSLSDPPMDQPGMRTIVLGPGGRLRSLTVVPVSASGGGAGAPGDRAPLFELAGLDMAAFDPAPPEKVPPVFADSRAAWMRRQDAGPPLRVETAWLGSRLVWADIDQPRAAAAASGEDTTPLVAVLSIVLFVGLIGGGTMLTVRNIRLGRGDIRGATRAAAVAFVLSLLGGLFAAKHSAGFEELLLLIWCVGISLWFGAASWVLYLAVEPFVRRRWPDLIISWSRLIAGRLNDPLIGRDVLIGASIGVGVNALTLALISLARQQGWATMPLIPNAVTMQGLNFAIGLAAHSGLIAFMNAMLLTVLLVLLTVVLRRRVVALVAFYLVLLAISASGAVTPLDRLEVLGPPTVMTLLVGRFGLVAIVAFHLFLFLSGWFPLTFRFDAGYASASAVAMVPIVLITAWSVYTTLGGKPFAGLGTLDDD